MTYITILALFIIIVLKKTFLVVQQHETVVKERLGKPRGTLTPGFHFMVPFIDRAAYNQEMREQVLDVPPQSCITKDNIQVEVDVQGELRHRELPASRGEPRADYDALRNRQAGFG